MRDWWRRWWRGLAERRGLLVDPAEAERMKREADERDRLIQTLEARLSVWTRGESDDRSRAH